MLVTAVVVDVANVVGSRPDGWWRDRAGATATLLRELAAWAGGVDADVIAVVEGDAKVVPDVEPLTVIRARGEGDDAVVAAAGRHTGCLVVTADRGLRARLGDTPARGPQWLLQRLAPRPRS